MKYFTRILVFASIGIISASVVAQGDCPAIVESALAATEQMCEATGRNQVCYGNALLDVEPQPDADTFEFTEPGDLLGLELVRNLSLSPMDTSENVWGVALMNIQANLPDTLPGQNVTFLMFGDVEVRVPTNTESVTLNATATGGVNVHNGPSTNNTVVAGLSLGQSVTVNGRLEDSSWLRVVLPDDDEAVGWVFAELVAMDGDSSLLEVVDPTQTASQAFYFRTGFGDAPCEEAPNSGILIRTPDGAGQISLTLNEVNIQLGSTAYLQAVPGEEMVLNLIDGKAHVEAFGVQQQVLTNMRIRVPLSDDLAAAGPPRLPETCDTNDLTGLPGGYGDCIHVRVVIDHDCPATVPFGMEVELHFGAGYDTEAEARAALEEEFSRMTINGQSVTITRFGPYFVPQNNHYAYGSNHDWGAPPPGVYTIDTVDQNAVRMCEVTILEPPE